MSGSEESGTGRCTRLGLKATASMMKAPRGARNTEKAVVPGGWLKAGPVSRGGGLASYLFACLAHAWLLQLFDLSPIGWTFCLQEVTSISQEQK